ncbi:MAG: ABC transporter ATP-binding protein [Oligoflexales bacterium]|nr:ABC transporter ATP-binding protein [Oligoflexales bacterium]
MTEPAQKKILEVENLKVRFSSEQGSVFPVDDVSFSLNPGEVLGIVGESGCGKTLTALSCLNLLPFPGVIETGEVWFNGDDVLKLNEKKLRHLRGAKIAMVFQESMTALNPVYRIGSQLSSIISMNRKVSKKQAKALALDYLTAMGIPGAEQRLHDFPHQLSGGMRQRVLIALALACEPQILIADEPTTALDVTTQAFILDKIRGIQASADMATILVSHDLGVVAEFCHRVIVMYCGRIIEKASIQKIFTEPRHPYTVGLLNSIPQVRQKVLHRLQIIEGAVPNLHDLSSGCRFANRCSQAQDRCFREEPFLSGSGGHEVACFYPREVQ